MNTPSHARVARIHWTMLRMERGDRSFPTTLTGPARLIALYHWRRGKALPGMWVVENAPGQASPEPDQVDWSEFPMSQARDEVMAHEARFARHLMRLSSPARAAQAQASGM